MTVARLLLRENGDERRLGRIPRAQALGVLPYAPPAGTYTDVHISNATLAGMDIPEMVLNAGVDYNIIFDEVMTKRVRITGGRNVKIVGAEFNITSENVRSAVTPTTTSYLDNNNCMEFGQQSGTTFIEGLFCHGPYALDSIRLPVGSSNTDFVIQNCRLEVDRVITGITDSPDGFLHTDGLQCWGGLRSLRMHNVTICNPYQGGMYGDGALGGRWGPTLLSRVNYRPGLTVGQSSKLINFVGSAAYMRGPFTLRDVYYQIGSSATWSNTYAPPMVPPYTGGAFYSSMTVGVDEYGRDYGQVGNLAAIAGLLGVDDGEGGPGRYYRGLPPHGDYVVAGGTGPGFGYVSPGYLP